MYFSTSFKLFGLMAFTSELGQLTWQVLFPILDIISYHIRQSKKHYFTMIVWCAGFDPHRWLALKTCCSKLSELKEDTNVPAAVSDINRSRLCNTKSERDFFCQPAADSILMPPAFPIASLNRYTPKFSWVPQKLTWCQQFGLQIFPK